MARNFPDLAARIEESLADRVLLNLHAQAHAHAILSELRTPLAEQPQFTAGLDERLYLTANFFVCSGIDLLQGVGYENLSARALTRGAESLEFLATSSTDRRFRTFLDTLKSAVAYHIAGHHARAYVLVERLRAQRSPDDRLSQIVLHLLDRNFLGLRNLTLDIFASAATNDAILADLLERNDFDETTAISSLGERSLAEAVSIYLEYLKVGRVELLEEALAVVSSVTNLAREARLVDLWWWANAIRYLLQEFGGSSLWAALRGFSPDGSVPSAIWRYIRGCLIRKPPITSIWPSQRPALEWITREGRPSFCVRMPTSSGKTRIAELTILRALMDGGDDPSTKCIYIAPFRSLAVEIERTLKRAFNPLGIRVSEIYGGFELSDAERRLVEDTQVLIVTPEKLDAMVRQAPDLIGGVKLFVVDEGHLAGDVSSRGIHSEFLLNRLLNAFPRPKCRYLFLSGVLPNPEDFARWIGGDQSHLVMTNWRPSRLMVGTCKWNGKRIRLDFTHEGQTKFEQNCFVPNFVRLRVCKGIIKGRGARSPFPRDGSEAFAAAAIQCALQATTLIFMPQAQHVESLGKQIASALAIQRQLDLAEGIENRWKHQETNAAWLKARAAVMDELGAESALLQLLDEGVVVHHAKLPTRVRLSFEALIRSGEVRIIIATTTLSSGVNLPVRTVLVRGLQQSQTRQVSALEFWNIAGRAGRALCENEGQILFFIDETKQRWQVRKLEHQIANTIETTQHAAILGAMYVVLRTIHGAWQKIPNAPDLAQLCLRLAEDNFDWAGEQKPFFEALSVLVDKNILALTAEAGLTNEVADRLQELLRRSLLFTRLGAGPLEGLTGEIATSILDSRLRSIHRRIPDQDRRNRFYRLGFSIPDCQLVEAEEDALLAKFRAASDWAEWDQATRIGALQAIAAFALKLRTIRQATREELPENFSSILSAWLRGHRPIEIAEMEKKSGSDLAPAAAAKIIEAFCVYSLAWAANSLYGHLTKKVERSGNPLPPVCSFFSSMFKFGLSDPLAALFVPYLDGNRTIAVAAAEISPFSYTEPDKALSWLHSASATDLVSLGMESGDADTVTKLRRAQFNDGADGTANNVVQYKVTFANGVTLGLRERDRVIVKGEEGSNRIFSLFTARGRALGTYQSPHDFPLWWNSSDEIDAEIQSCTPEDHQALSATVMIRRI